MRARPRGVPYMARSTVSVGEMAAAWLIVPKCRTVLHTGTEYQVYLLATSIAQAFRLMETIQTDGNVPSSYQTPPVCRLLAVCQAHT